MVPGHLYTHWTSGRVTSYEHYGHRVTIEEKEAFERDSIGGKDEEDLRKKGRVRRDGSYRSLRLAWSRRWGVPV